MRRILYLILFCSPFPLLAQQIAVHGGVALPSGSYSNTSLSETTDRFAGPGSYLALEIQYPLYKKAELMVQGGVANQSFREDEYNTQIEESTPGAVTSVSAQSGYHSSYALLGGLMRFPKGNFSFILNASAGFIYFSSPAFSKTTQYPSTTGYEYMESASDMGLLFSWGMQAQYALPKQFVVGVQLSNQSSDLELPANNYVSGQTQTNAVRFDVYHVGAMLGYRF